MIPNFNKHGLLPVGIFECTIEEIMNEFIGPPRFENPSNKRKILLNRLQEFVDFASKIPVVISIYVDGSFVTNKEEPGDVDVLIEILDPLKCSIPDQHQKPLAQLRKAWQPDIHAFLYWPGLQEDNSKKDFLDFFMTLRPQEAKQRGVDLSNPRRGILRIPVGNPVPPHCKGRL